MEPAPLTDERLARMCAARARMRLLGDPVLRRPAAKVLRFDERLSATAEEMVELMDDALGVGLAAPQLGDSRQLAVVRAEPQAPARVLVNPRIVRARGEKLVAVEGCLSIPEQAYAVARAPELLVRYQDLHGRAQLMTVHDYEARVFAHEIDHLCGVLISDHGHPVSELPPPAADGA